MNAPNVHATMIAWMRRSGEMLRNPLRIASTAPECFNTNSSSSAPHTM